MITKQSKVQLHALYTGTAHAYARTAAYAKLGSSKALEEIHESSAVGLAVS